MEACRRWRRADGGGVPTVEASDGGGVRLADRDAVQHALVAEAGEIDRAELPEDDELAERPSDRWRLLQAVTGEACGEVEVLVHRGTPDDEVLVERVVVVVATPGAGQLDRLEGRYAQRECRPYVLVEQFVVDFGVLGRRVPFGRGREVDDESRALGPEADTGLGDRQRRLADWLPALEHVRAPFARLDRQLDTERFADLRCPRGAGRVDHDPASDAARSGQRHPGDARAVAAHRDHFVVDELDTQGPSLAPVCLEERVGVDVSLAAVAQESAGDVAGTEPRTARAQLIGGSEVNVGPELALHRVAVEHRRQHRLGRGQKVAVLAETHIGRIAVDREVGVEPLEEFDSEQPHPDILGGGELLSKSTRGLCRRGILIGRIAFDDQHRSIESRLPGEEQRRGATGDAASDNHHVVSGVHAAIIPCAVFPPHAGMNRRTRFPRSSRSCVPRLRGDEPVGVPGGACVPRCSPPARGRTD